MYYTWKNIKEEYKNNKFKISGPTWVETFALPDGSYTVEDIQDYFLCGLFKNMKLMLNLLKNHQY